MMLQKRSSRSCERTSRRQAQRGFTIIEAMMATTVFMISIMGLVAMEKVTMTSASRAKSHTAAVNIAQFVMTRIQSEASIWPVSFREKNHEDYPFLHYVLQANAQLAEWQRLPNNVNSAVPQNFRIGEYLGQTFDKYGTPAQYCVNYMLEPMGHHDPANMTDDQIFDTMVWRVRVRVAWPKEGHYVDGGTSLWDNCDPAMWLANGPRIHKSEFIELVGYATRERASGRRM